MFEVNKNPSAAELRKFGWAMLIGFSVLGVILWLGPWIKAKDPVVLLWRGGGAQIAAIVLWAVGVVLCLLGTQWLRAAKRVYVAWMTATIPIGVLMSKVLLTVLYFGLLPIFSVIVRLNDPFRRRKKGETYWEPYRPHEPTLERMRRPF